MGSARSLPATMAHVWRKVRRRSQGVWGLESGVGDAVPELRYNASQRKSHKNPSAPVTTNAQRQPQFSAIHGTMSGVRIAPVLVPALKMPVARARSSLGNHSPTLLIAPGKLADSPRPSSARAAENAAVVRAIAWPIAARLHTTTAVAKPRRTPTRSSQRPAIRKPKAYTRVNEYTTAAYCDSDQLSSRCKVGARMLSTWRSM